MKPYTKASLERELRDAFNHPGTRFIVRPLRNVGNILHSKDEAVVSIDPVHGYLAVTVHELLHKVLDPKHERFGFLREPYTLTAENEMVKYINKNRLSLEWWRQRLDETFEIYDRD